MLPEMALLTAQDRPRASCGRFNILTTPPIWKWHGHHRVSANFSQNAQSFTDVIDKARFLFVIPFKFCADKACRLGTK